MKSVNVKSGISISTRVARYVTIAAAVSTLACSERGEPLDAPKAGSEQSMTSDEIAVAMFDPMLAFLGHDLGWRKSFTCMVAGLRTQLDEGFGEGSGEGTTDRFVEEMLVEGMQLKQRLCELLSQAVAARDSEIAAIAEIGRSPENIFAFSYFEHSHSEEYETHFEETQVGPFLDRASCERLEAEMHQAGLGTRICQRWPSRILEHVRQKVRMKDSSIAPN